MKVERNGLVTVHFCGVPLFSPLRYTNLKILILIKKILNHKIKKKIILLPNSKSK